MIIPPYDSPFYKDYPWIKDGPDFPKWESSCIDIFKKNCPVLTESSVSFDVPGVEKNQLVIEFNNGNLLQVYTIKDAPRHYSFAQILENIDESSITAELKNGVLIVNFKKKDNNNKKVINIK